EDAAKDKDFHFIHKPIQLLESLDFLRIDYAFFCLNDLDNPPYLAALTQFLKSIKNFSDEKDQKPKIVFISSIELYKRQHSDERDKGSLDFKKLEQAEVKLAKFVKDHNLNGRIVRLGGVFGPRMHFNYPEPLFLLIRSSLLGKLQEEQVSLEFSS